MASKPYVLKEPLGLYLYVLGFAFAIGWLAAALAVLFAFNAPKSPGVLFVSVLPLLALWTITLIVMGVQKLRKKKDYA